MQVDEDAVAELLRVLDSTPVVDGRQRDLLEADSPLREVRDALQAVVRGQQAPTSLQRWLDGHARRPQATEAGVVWVDDARDAATRLVLAWGQVEQALPGRLRPCANPECALFLLDRSRGGAGRWCSMAACGNRAKARRHYERHRRPQDG